MRHPSSPSVSLGIKDLESQNIFWRLLGHVVPFMAAILSALQWLANIDRLELVVGIDDLDIYKLVFQDSSCI